MLKPIGMVTSLYELAIRAPAVCVPHFNALQRLGLLILSNTPCVHLQGCTLDYASMLRVTLDDHSVSLTEASVAELNRMRQCGVLYFIQDQEAPHTA